MSRPAQFEMLASIITSADVRSSFVFVGIFTAVFAAVPILRLWNKELSFRVSWSVFCGLCLWSGYVAFEMESSACPGFEGRLWPFSALLVGSLNLLAHFDFVNRYKAFHLGMALFLGWMMLISNWDAPLDVWKAISDTKSELEC